MIIVWITIAIQFIEFTEYHFDTVSLQEECNPNVSTLNIQVFHYNEYTTALLSEYTEVILSILYADSTLQYTCKLIQEYTRYEWSKLCKISSVAFIIHFQQSINLLDGPPE